MPLIGFICPEWSKTAGDRNKFHEGGIPLECLNCADPCMDTSTLMVIVKQTYKGNHKGDMISVTSLEYPLATYLERTVDYYEEPPDCWARTRGSLIHSILEYDNRPGVMKEQFIQVKIPGSDVVLCGTYDKYYTPDQRLTDYKSAHDNFYKFKSVEIPKPSHVRQLNVYRLMLEALGVSVREMQVVYVTMSFTRPYWVSRMGDELWGWVKERAEMLSTAFRSGVPPPPCPTVDPDLRSRNWKCPGILDKKGNPQRGYCTVGKIACNYAKQLGGM